MTTTTGSSTPTATDTHTTTDTTTPTPSTTTTGSSDSHEPSTPRPGPPRPIWKGEKSARYAFMRQALENKQYDRIEIILNKAKIFLRCGQGRRNTVYLYVPYYPRNVEGCISLTVAGNTIGSGMMVASARPCSNAYLEYRDTCQCDKCVNRATMQRNHNTFDVRTTYTEPVRRTSIDSILRSPPMLSPGRRISTRMVCKSSVSHCILSSIWPIGSAYSALIGSDDHVSIHSILWLEHALELKTTPILKAIKYVRLTPRKLWFKMVELIRIPEPQSTSMPIRKSHQRSPLRTSWRIATTLWLDSRVQLYDIPVAQSLVLGKNSRFAEITRLLLCYCRPAHARNDEEAPGDNWPHPKHPLRRVL